MWMMESLRQRDACARRPVLVHQRRLDQSLELEERALQRRQLLPTQAKHVPICEQQAGQRASIAQDQNRLGRRRRRAVKRNIILAVK